MKFFWCIQWAGICGTALCITSYKCLVTQWKISLHKCTSVFICYPLLHIAPIDLIVWRYTISKYIDQYLEKVCNCSIICSAKLSAAERTCLSWISWHISLLCCICNAVVVIWCIERSVVRDIIKVYCRRRTKKIPPWKSKTTHKIISRSMTVMTIYVV